MSARKIAYDILYRIYYEDAYASLLMRKQLQSLSKEDRGLVSEIVYGTLRNRLYLEKQLSFYTKKPRKKSTCVLLDMSAYQILFLDKVPSYAVVNEAVSLANQGDKGFVNAVLRNLVQNGRKEIEEEDPLEALCIHTSHPLWILKLWKAHYGLENTERIAKFDQTPAKVYGRINTLKTTKESLCENPKFHFLDAYSFTYDGILQESPEFKRGEVVIQDYASAQIVPYLNVKKGQRIMDCCAAPGTKTQQIGMLLENEGELYASDLYEDRVHLIEELMERTGVRIAHTFVRDCCIEEKAFKENPFDAILLDVPCSGLGDLRHKPEIRYQRHPEDLDLLVSIQKRMLEVNANYVKQGGILVYSTCTLNKKENEYQIANFLATHQDYALLFEKTFFPFTQESDGFYVAQLRKL
ncbi:MAG: 16S rRNA (cytosine(967)-C(5))-methyltransferase RsmB [Solobacterium sp.]|nr:16S rRNA (cytosine(967)-C(5))-methyltransferase RsmB [Solobacterium sp.]